MTENVKNAGEPKVGPDGPPVENVSGQVPTVGATMRPAQRRDTYGKYRQRGTTLVRGLDASEPLEWVTDAVTGQRIRGRNNSMLIREQDRPVHYLSLDHNRGRSDEATAALADFQMAVNHVLDCGLGC